ncbi:ATP-binding protein [Deinococcus cellulosilyticus]|nr:AAA family ATPase [Deinococcus cellulosilyticus]
MPQPTAATSCWHLQTLGTVNLCSGHHQRPLDRRTALLLAYLALEGKAHKHRLAGMLWPDSGEVTARANMRQLLRRLRVGLGASVVDGTVHLHLTDAVQVDVCLLQDAVASKNHQKVLAFEGELLEGIEVDDLPEIQEWLVSAREQVFEQRRQAALAESLRLEQEKDWQGALTCALMLLQLDRLSEEAHRLVMRLQYLLGDRGAALAAFERCRQVLQEALGTDPTPQTCALARDIQQGALPGPAGPGPAALPLSVLRPPVLVGREQHLQRLQKGKATGLLPLLTGETGMGKTRLALDFAHQQGAAVHVAFRSTDQGIPYAGLSRLLKMLLQASQRAQWPGWVRQEVARIVPHLHPEVPAPITSDLERLRFFEALVEGITLSAKDLPLVVLDDVHHVDPASLEFLQYLFSKVLPEQAVFLVTCTSHSADLPRVWQDLVQAGLAFQVHLEALRPHEMQEMLDHMGEAFAEKDIQLRLMDYSAGNPMLLVEAARYLLESDGSLLPEGPIGGQVRQVLQKRLENLPLEVLRVARAAAVLGNDFTLQRVAEVLGNPPETLQVPWEALHEKQLLQQDRFTHSELPEVVLGSTPPAVLNLLHRRAAQILVQEQAPAAEIGRHWLAAGHPLEAAAEFSRAGEHATLQYRARESAHFHAQAAELHEALGDRVREFESLARQADALGVLADLEAHEGVLHRLEALASTPDEKATYHLHLAQHHFARENIHLLAQIAREGIHWVRQTTNHVLELRFQEVLFFEAYYRRDSHAALQAVRQAAELAEKHGEVSWQARAIEGEALIVGNHDLQASIGLLLKAEQLYREAGDRTGIAAAASKRGTDLVKSGEVHQALQAFEEAHQNLQDIQGHDDARANSIYGMSVCLALLGRYRESLGWLKGVREGQYRHLPMQQMIMQVRLAGMLLTFGAPDEALVEVSEILKEGKELGYNQADLLLVAARIHRHLGRTADARRIWEDAHQSNEEHPDHFTTIRLRLEEAAHLPLEAQVEALQGMEAFCRSHHLDRAETALQARRAILHLQLGLEPLEVNPTEAHLYFFGMEDRWLLQAHQAALLPPVEARQALEALRARVQQVVSEHVPVEHQATYLRANPQMVALQAVLGPLTEDMDSRSPS